MLGLIRTMLLLLVGSALAFDSAYAAETIKIGVLAFRPKPQTLQQWLPLGVALKQALPAHDFEVEAYTFPELETAVNHGQVDFVLTNPGHYALLTNRFGLSAPLATLSIDQSGQATSVFGGVIFTRAKQADINRLADLKGKTIAAVSTDSFGGYQMQAAELIKSGLHIPQDAKLLTTGMPHDNVVAAVLTGHAEVGFVRTGVLEDLAHEGKLDMNQLKIVNRQQWPNFPLQLSTRLYPEWAFAVMPHVDDKLARQVTAALYVLEDNTAATRAMKIHGFVVPPDYTPVFDLLKSLRLPPFDEIPSFTIHDVWTRYLWQIVAMLAACLLILLLAMRLLLASRKLRSQHRTMLLQTKQLKASEDYLKAIIENEPECIKIIDAQGRLKRMNPAGLAMIEADSSELVLGKSVLPIIAPEYREAFADMHRKVIAGETVQMEFEIIGLKGSRRRMETHAVPLQEGGETVQLAVTRDITARNHAEEELRKSHSNMHSLLNSMAEGAYGIDTEGNCSFVNQSCLRLLGYDESNELVGRYIHEIIHYAYADGSPYPASQCQQYAVMQTQQAFSCADEVFWRKDGTALPVEYWVQPIVTDGKTVGACITFVDITERKQTQEAIRQSEIKFHTLYDATSDAVQMLDETGFIDCNKASLLLFGCATQEEFCRYHPAELSPPQQPDGTDSMTLANHFITLAMRDGSARFEWLHKRLDSGQTFAADVQLTAIPLAGKVVLQATVRDISTRKKMEEQALQLAFFDPLTQLPNRRLLNDRLGQALSANKRKGHYSAVLFIDLDNFKPLNDTHGHMVGDLLLIEAASRLKHCVREIDTVARFGGDEFVIMLTELASNEAESYSQASLIAEKIRATLAEPYNLTLHHDDGTSPLSIEHTCTASIGVIVFSNHMIKQLDILKSADAAMYQAKEAGRNQIRFYARPLDA